MISDQAVEAAARALFHSSPVSKGHKPWGAQMDERIKQQFKADARAALEAAAPHIMEQAADELIDAGYEVKRK